MIGMIFGFFYKTCKIPAYINTLKGNLISGNKRIQLV